jgi:pyruvate dehydrogenase E1 component alpha subunit
VLFKEQYMVSKNLLKTMYQQIYRIRVFETQSIKLYRNGFIRGYFHPYLGEEAIAVGVCSALGKQDYIVSTHRGHGHCIARGATLDKMVAELLGKKTGYCRGWGGSMHIADVESGNLGANGIVGGGMAIGMGAALGAKIRGDKRVSAVFFSDGACNGGPFGETINMAAIWQLPAIFIIENNGYAVSTPIEQSCVDCDLYTRAAAYGVSASQVDGNDVIAVYEATVKAHEACMKGLGPVVIECKTYRHQGHHVNDLGEYMPKDKLAYYKGEHDPVNLARPKLVEVIGEKSVAEIEAAVIKEMDEAIEFAKASPEPDLQEFLDEVKNCYY